MKPLNKLIDIFSFEDEYDRTPAVVVEDDHKPAFDLDAVFKWAVILFVLLIFFLILAFLSGVLTLQLEFTPSTQSMPMLP